MNNLKKIICSAHDNMPAVYCATILFIITYIVVLAMMNAPSDFAPHIEMAKKMATGESFIIYPLWHIFVCICALLEGNWIHGAAFTTAAFNVLGYILVFIFLNQQGRFHIGKRKAAILALSILLLGKFWLPFQDLLICDSAGGGAPNIWHNPTNMCVRPFAVLIFILTVDVLQYYIDTGTIRQGKVQCIAILLAVSCLAKPSFFLAFVPGLALFLLVSPLTIRHDRKLYYAFFLAVIPSALMVIIQYMNIFIWQNFWTDAVKTSHGIEFAWLEVWRHHNPVLISFFAGLCFPLYVLFNNRSALRYIDIRLALSMLIVSLLQKSFLAEVGQHRFDGNFGWAYLLAMFILYMVAAKHFFAASDLRNWRMTVGKLIFVYQLLIGIWVCYGFVVVYCCLSMAC